VLSAQVEAASELLSSLQNTYLANVSIDVAEQSEQSNEIMKNLSAVATIVLPLSLIAGMFGMNVQVPWQHDSTNDLATLAPFITISGGMLVVTVLMVIYFKYANLM
jgi:magnesium transporter